MWGNVPTVTSCNVPVVTSEILTLGLKKSSQRCKSTTGTNVLANISNKP